MMNNGGAPGYYHHGGGVGATAGDNLDQNRPNSIEIRRAYEQQQQQQQQHHMLNGPTGNPTDTPTQHLFRAYAGVLFVHLCGMDSKANCRKIEFFKIFLEFFDKKILEFWKTVQFLENSPVIWKTVQFLEN